MMTISRTRPKDALFTRTPLIVVLPFSNLQNREIETLIGLSRIVCGTRSVLFFFFRFSNLSVYLVSRVSEQFMTLKDKD